MHSMILLAGDAAITTPMAEPLEKALKARLAKVEVTDDGAAVLERIQNSRWMLLVVDPSLEGLGDGALVQVLRSTHQLRRLPVIYLTDAKEVPELPNVQETYDTSISVEELALAANDILLENDDTYMG